MGNYEDMFPPMNNLKLKTMKTMEKSDKREKKQFIVLKWIQTQSATAWI